MDATFLTVFWHRVEEKTHSNIVAAKEQPPHFQTIPAAEKNDP